MKLYRVDTTTGIYTFTYTRKTLLGALILASKYWFTQSSMDWKVRISTFRL
jgi:hypothetical protein